LPDRRSHRADWIQTVQLHLHKQAWPGSSSVTLPRVLQWLLLGLLAVQGARLAWMVAVPLAPIGEPLAAAAPVAVQRPGDSALDPFFPADSAPTGASASGVTLHGISTGPAGASAILGVANRGQMSLRVGESLQAGIRLVAIGADHVLIESGDGRQRLGFATTQAATAATASLPSATPAAVPPSALDPDRLLEQAGLAPREVGGRVSGYTLIPRGDGALLRQAGLQAGDVLLSVNGQALTPERYQGLAAELAGRESLEITFQRDGATQSITVPLQ